MRFSKTVKFILQIETKLERDTVFFQNDTEFPTMILSSSLSSSHRQHLSSHSTPDNSQ